LEEEKEFLKAIEEAREDFRKARKLWHKLFLPKLWIRLLEYCSTEIPEKKFQELVQKTKIDIAEARKETIEIWNDNLENIFSSIKKQFQQPIKPGEIEKRVSALIDLLTDTALFIAEELKVIDKMEAGLEKVTKKE